MSTLDESEFDAYGWFAEQQISDDGVKRLKEHGISDLHTLMLFRESDIDKLELRLGDSLRFREGIVKLNKDQDSMPALLDGTGKPITKKGEDKERDSPKFSLRQVEELLAGKAAIDSGRGVGSSAILEGAKSRNSEGGSSLLSDASSATVSHIRELMKDLLNVDGVPTNVRGEKVLLPVNFLSCVRGTQDSEEIIHSGKGLNLVLQTTAKKVTPDKLSVGQWTGANARVLQKLISEGRLNAQQLDDYLDYNRKIGDLLQLYTAGSVFMLDNNHRLEIHEKPSRCWSEIDSTLQNAHLQKKNELYNAASSVRGNVTVGTGVKRGVRPCWKFNSEEGCPFGKDACRYDHVEGDSRPQRSSFRNDRAPRFQNQASGGVSTQAAIKA
jgi:hypothetical protein